MIKVALLAPSPVPFKVPLYRRISDSADIDLTVIYSAKMGITPSTAGYSEPVIWDVDLTSGYRVEFLKKADRNVPIAGLLTELVDVDIVPWLVRNRFDVLWSEGYNWITNLLGMLTQRTLGLGVVVRDTQNLLHPRTLPKTLVKEVVLRGLLSQVDAAAYIGRENRRWLEHYGLPPQRLFSCPYGPDAEFFANEAHRLRPQRETLRAEFGFAPEDGPILLSMARLAPMKQPRLLLEAFSRVRAKQRCGLLVVGSGPLEAELQELVESEEIPDVRFAGFLNQSEVSRAYAAADVFVLLSAWGETFGVVVSEAMHFGLPLVLSDKVGSAADLLGDGANGFLVARDDIGGVERALGGLVGDEKLRAAFGAASLQRITERRDLDRATAGAVAAIRYAAHRRKAGGNERIAGVRSLDAASGRTAGPGTTQSSALTHHVEP